MSIFNVLDLVGGLSLFLFGMSIMGQALERRAGSGLRALLGKMTGNKWSGLLTGLAVTAVIQSSSATTVMVVGFVNSGLMTLKQSIHVIMGANIGTTVTAWILSLAGIDSSNIFIKLLKPSSFTPVLALIGIILYMFTKEDKKKDTGMILLGFATLMFGMESMSGAVSGLKDIPEFQQLFLMFTNPVPGVLVGAVLTAIIQSSSASVGILQALASTGAVTYGAAIPIIMGQNIGTCVTALLSSIGTNKNARRTALVHLSFNVIGTAVCLTAFCIVRMIHTPALLSSPASLLGIAVAHSAFNVVCTLIMLPLSGFLEKLVYRMIPESAEASIETEAELDERLLTTPSVALERVKAVTGEMASCACKATQESIDAIWNYSPDTAEAIRSKEDLTDHYEDIIGTYLVKLSAKKISAADSADSAKYLKLINDFERIADHSVNILESVEEMREKNIVFSPDANSEMKILTAAVEEILLRSFNAFLHDSPEEAYTVEPLEQVIDERKEEMRNRHIRRLQQGKCSIGAGFVILDMLTDLERIGDHCSNIAGCIIDAAEQTMNMHETLNHARITENYEELFSEFSKQYRFPALPGAEVLPAI